MNKKGHLLLTERIIGKDFQPYKRWLMFGSILPDLLYHTYLTGHTWESAFEKIARKMESFESWGGMNGFSCMYLGYLLHYVEDFFTFPHNSGFRGRLAEHIQYEKQFTQYLLSDNDQPALNMETVTSTDDLKDQLCRLHEKYEQEQTGFETDERYICQAVGCVMQYFAGLMCRNQHLFDATMLEMISTPQQPLIINGQREV